MHILLYARLLPGRLHGNQWTSERETGLKRLRRQIADQVADLSGVSRAQRHPSSGCIATKEGEAKPAFRFSKGSGVGDLERVRDLERADRFAIGRVRQSEYWIKTESQVHQKLDQAQRTGEMRSLSLCCSDTLFDEMFYDGYSRQ